MKDDINKFTATNLVKLIGQRFSIKDVNNNCVEIVLTEVHKKELKGIKGEAFVAIFEHPESIVLEDASYLVEHTDIGGCSLYISPNSPTECEVIVSRINNDCTAPVPEKREIDDELDPSIAPQYTPSPNAAPPESE